MFDLLNTKPKDLAALGLSLDMLENLGVKIEEVTTLKQVTDLSMLVKALKGDVRAKQYIDEAYKADEKQRALNRKKD